MSTQYEIRIVPVDGVHDNPLNGASVNSPETAMPYLENIRNQWAEHFVCLTLNGAGNVINCRVITIGLLNHSLVHPRETFRGAILDNAASIIIAHNHPSGSLEPSSQDIAITRQLTEAGAIIGIQVIDHLIVSKTGFLSMKDRGLM
jgi:DNA repair protein RadC